MTRVGGPGPPGVDACPQWFWRWGIVLLAGLAALAAAIALAMAWYWELDGAAVTTTARLKRMATLATAFAAALVVFRVLAVVRTPATRIPASSSSAVPNTNGAEAVLAVVVVATGIGLAAHNLDAPLRPDESMTIVKYATQPLATAAGQYESPNNHVLHTLLVWVAHQLGGWSRVVLRIPAFAAGCLLLPAVWWFAREEYGWKSAALATAFVSTAPYFREYATNARGYTLMLLLFVCALLLGRTLVRSPGNRAAWAGWATAIALGLFAVPVMGYPAASAVLWMVFARWRRYGRRELGHFAFRMAAWTVAAFGLAAVLYAPVLAAEGFDHFRSVLAGAGLGWPLPIDRALQMLQNPIALWTRWHLGIPTWAQGTLLALVVVGATVRGRSCGRRGTLLLGLGAATGLFLLAKPAALPDRVGIGALLLLMIVAGAGAARVLEGVAARPRAAAGTSRGGFDLGAGPSRPAPVPLYAAVGAILVAFAWWSTRPGVASRQAEWGTELPPLPALVSSAEAQVRPGDDFAVHGMSSVRQRTILYVREGRNVAENMGVLHYVPYLPSPVHRVLAPSPSPSSPSPGEPFDEAPRPHSPRLLLFAYETFSRVSLESRWPGRYESVSAFDHGRVYMVNDWVSPR